MAAIRALPGRKFILTNGDVGHARSVLDRLGNASGLFDDIFDIVRAELLPKPAPETYDRFVMATGVDPRRAAMFEDLARNLVVPQALGMATVLWCYTRNNAFKVNGTNYETASDLTGQANHLGVTIGADIIKQKLPTNNGGFKALNTGGSSYGKLDERIYTKLTSDHPIDLTRYQVANCYMGRSGLISSGGASGANDFEDAIETAVINKRAGGTGLISGRKAFQRPMSEGAALLNAIQDVYLCEDVTIA